jgi:rhodanese-related sulfurtransferase
MPNSDSYKMDEVAGSPLAESPSGLDVQHDITLDQIQNHMRNNTAVLIDARSPESFARGHLRGAINVPSGQIETFVSQIKKNVSEDELIIIYCASSTCGAGTWSMNTSGQGYTNMRVYKPGWRQQAKKSAITRRRVGVTGSMKRMNLITIVSNCRNIAPQAGCSLFAAPMAVRRQMVYDKVKDEAEADLSDD